ncbi:hypothetical protein TUST1-10_01025 [Vibrio phage ICP1_2004_A]|nr:hypothetical protein TUST1-10_01025 [Vibrio phage ICP1_2004_A]
MQQLNHLHLFTTDIIDVYTTGGKTKFYREYSYWRNMNTRCNNPNYSEKYPTYIDVCISEEFSDYDFFVGWCRSLEVFKNDHWVLDKDIILKGNKCYHPDLCTFVPSEVNGFFVMRTSKRDKDLPVGVSWCESEGKYKTYCSQLNGKNKTVGRFLNVDDAAIAYVTFKNNLAKELSSRWKGIVDERVIKTLNKYDVRDYITDEVTNYRYFK